MMCPNCGEEMQAVDVAMSATTNPTPMYSKKFFQLSLDKHQNFYYI